MFGAGAPFPDDVSIRLDDVSFSYGKRDAPEVLHGVSLDVSAGERLAIVGPSGSGKSTLIQLVGRFYDVTAGSVSIGGIDVREIDYDDLLSHVSVVFQKTFLTSVDLPLWRGPVTDTTGNHPAILRAISSMLLAIKLQPPSAHTEHYRSR